MISGIITGIGALLAYFFFKRGQNAEALLDTLKTKEQDLEKKQEILQNEATMQVEAAKRDAVNTNADAEKTKELTNEELAKALNSMLNNK